MYIILIAWMYVVVLLAAAENTITAGVLTFLFYGLVPCALLLWILGVKHRRYKKFAKDNLAGNSEVKDSAEESNQ